MFQGEGERGSERERVYVCVYLTEILTYEVSGDLDSPPVSVIRKMGERAWQ